MALPQNDGLGPLDRQNVVNIETPPPSQTRRILIEAIETITLALVLFFAINFLSARIRVDGSSMEPNFHDGDYIIVNRMAYRAGEIERGDVVVFPYPLNDEVDYIKRVIGLPGDTIAIYSGVVYVNGEEITEPYILEAQTDDRAEQTVPQDSVFVMGDNRNNSEDSRAWGFLKIEDIIGKAIFRYWPFDAAGAVEHPDIVFAGSG
jgi:signal peptidase I